VQCSAVQCSAVQCSAVRAVQCSAVQCSAVQCSAVQFDPRSETTHGVRIGTTSAPPSRSGDNIGGKVLFLLTLSNSPVHSWCRRCSNYCPGRRHRLLLHLCQRWRGDEWHGASIRGRSTGPSQGCHSSTSTAGFTSSCLSLYIHHLLLLILFFSDGFLILGHDVDKYSNDTSLPVYPSIAKLCW
jgi:hypothetical protein